jgi:diguanylate cyclase (GGDEF)-like protein/PAS domain S-box-containing protein
MNWLARIGRARPRPPDIAAAITLLGALGVTGVLVIAMRGAEQERARSVFLQHVAIRVAAINAGFGEALDVLRANKALFDSVGPVERAQFADFTRPLLQSHPWLQAVEFHRLVADRDRAAFEAARAGLRPGYAIRERLGDTLVRAPPRPRYLVVDYIEPVATNDQALGFDSFTNPSQASSFARMLAKGEPASSSLVPMVQYPGHMAVALGMAVYRPGAVAAQSARAADALGDVSVVLDVRTLAERILVGARLSGRPGTAVELLGPGEAGLQSVYHLDRLEDHATPSWYGWLGDPPLTAVHRFEFGGQPWELRMAARTTELAGAAAPPVTLVLGCLLSFVLASLVRARVARTQRIEALVTLRTADLRDALDVLRLFRRAIDASANAVILIDARRPGYPIVYVNPAFERIRGFTWGDAVGKRLLELGEKEPDQAAVAELRCAIRDRREGHASMRLRRRDGSELYAEVYIAPVNDESGNTTHFVMTQYDVTQAKRYEIELEAHARFDSLTGLANRALLHDRIDSALNIAGSRAPVWIVALDLDNFKYVNDTLGHGAGDALLKAAAARISGAVRRTDTVARTGGDEFVLVLTERAGEGEAADTVHGVLEALAHPLLLSGQELVLTGSAGVAAYPADGADAATLIQHAEVAMYRAKELGRNTVQFYMPTMNDRARERLALEGALRSALLQDEFELYYQPQVDLESGAVVGLEALIRWRHPSLGLVRPDRFIHLAEETGLIVPIGAWVLRTACRQNRAWQRAGYGPLRIGVNLSARQFAEPGLVHDIADVLEDTGLAANSLEIEITESLVMEDIEGAIRTMLELKGMGVKLSIDDFGTGYSSLSYLRRFPVDVLKIDRSFVRDIPFCEDDAALVAAIIELARGLRMRVIAEGVENEAQLDYLKRRGCDEVQGHVYARAAPGPDVEAMLRSGRPVRPHATSEP